MAGCWLLSQLAALLLAAAAVSQVQTVGAVPGSSVGVRCEDSSASGGGGWNLLDMLSNLLLGDGDDYDDDDDDDDDEDNDVAASSSEQRADSEEEDYGWWDPGLFDDSSSEEAASRAPPLPAEPVNSSLPDEADNSSLTRQRRAAAGWDLANIDVQAGKNWSVRIFDWVLVRRNPTTGQVEVKLNVPGLFSPAGGGGDDVDYVDGSDKLPEATSTDSEAGA